MKYSHLQSQPLKCFKLPELKGGIDNTGQKDNCLFKSQNMWFKDGKLQSRPGVFANSINAKTLTKNGTNNEFDYRLHDVTIDYLGREYRIATIGVNSDNFVYTLYIYLVASESNILSAGSLVFLRISSEIYNVPDNITFYTGTPQTGGGIFALISLKNCENIAEKSYNIYEINSELKEWQRIYDFYVPTVLINGQGNNYEAAFSEDKVSLKSPKALESQNLLNGRFYAYYTSDGRSNMFRLPVSDLSADSVVCRINYTPSLYVEWNISGQSLVDRQSFMGNEIMLELDREKGTLSFTFNGSPFAIPIMPNYNENNIKVTASKETKNGFAQVVDSSCSLTADGRIYLSGGTNGNVLMLAKGENPLYFPQRSTVEIGGTEPITALSIQSKKIIAFKKSESYYVSLRKGARINEIALLADNDKLFKSDDTLNCELISKTVGCEYKNTVCKLDGKTVWLGQDCETYVLSDIGFDGVKKLSNTLKNRRDFEYMDSFAVNYDNYYILTDGKTAFAFDLSEFSNPKLYFWSFKTGDTLCGGFCGSGRLWFLCNSYNSGIFYVASFKGENDVQMFYNRDAVLEAEIMKFESVLETRNYALSGQNHKNIIENIYIALAGKGRVNVKANGKTCALVDLRFSTDDYDKGEYKTVMIRPHLYDTERVKLNISSESGFSVGDIEIFYRKTG